MLSSYYRDIELFRFNERTGDIYIFASEELQIIISHNGVLEVCMKQDYDKMTNAELRAYILQNRGDDLDAMEAFFARRSPDTEATWFHPPKNP